MVLSQQVQPRGRGLGIGPKIDSALEAMNALMTRATNLNAHTVVTSLQPLSFSRSRRVG